MCAAILNENAAIVEYTSYWGLSKAEDADPEIISRKLRFTEQVTQKLANRGKDGLVYEDTTTEETPLNLNHMNHGKSNLKKKRMPAR